MPLTATAVKQAKPKEKDFKLSDEKGLFLLIKRNGSKYWRQKYRFGGKEKSLALGVFPDVSLKDARDRRDDARKLLSNGVDPSDIKRAKKISDGDAAANSFEVVAKEWFETRMRDKSKSHQDRTWRALEKDLFPSLRSRAVTSITAPDLLAALRKIERRGAIETAHRAKQVAGQIFRFAIVTGKAERDPSQDLTGALKSPIEKHHAAITTPQEVGKLLLAIDGFQGTATVKAALKLAPLFFCRPGELRHMEWAEIDWEKELWIIPAEKMKMKQPHIVPLCSQALIILKEQQLLTGRGRYVFPSARGGSRPLSENGTEPHLERLAMVMTQ